MKIPSILKPDLRATYLDNRLTEKVTYLQIPSDVHEEDLLQDIKNGAVQFQELPGYLKKVQNSNYVVISTDNEEQGYMAITYLEACRKNKVAEPEEYRLSDLEADEIEDDDLLGIETFQKIEEETIENQSESETYQEDKRQVPIIMLKEIERYLHHENDEDMFMDDYCMQGERGEMNQKPYWFSCRKESVCIINKKDFYFGFKQDHIDDQVEALSFFEKNDRVYILNVNDPTEKGPFTLDETPNDDLEMSDEMILKNEIVLRYIADELMVSLPEDKKKAYYKWILQGNLQKNHVVVSRGFPYEQILNLVFSMRNRKLCQQIERIVRYAIKDKDKTQAIHLTKSDFQFIDRFQRTASRGKQKKVAAKKRLMEELIGMDEVKEQVFDIVNVMKFNKMREANLLCENSKYHNVHVMLGAPGTAKTTVAKLMGQIMVEENLLPDNRFVCINGAELKGMYVGHSAPKTKALFDRYDIIVIDEAYSLVDDNGSTDEFSKEAIAQLIIELEEHATDKLVIFAGYGGRKVTEKNNKMRQFIESNPGIKSRITSTFYFDSYSADEMVEIFYRIAKLQSYKVDPKAKKILRDYFATRVDDETFGNGREARSLLENSVIYVAKRVFSEGKEKVAKEDLQRMTEADISAAIEKTKKANALQNADNRKRIGFY